MDVPRVPLAVDDHDEHHVGQQDSDGEEQHDQGPEDVAGAQDVQETGVGELGVGAAAVLEDWRDQDDALVIHLRVWGDRCFGATWDHFAGSTGALFWARAGGRSRAW